MYYNNYNILPLGARAVFLIIIFLIVHACTCVNVLSKVGCSGRALSTLLAGRGEPNLIFGAGFFLTGAKNMRVELILAP